MANASILEVVNLAMGLCGAAFNVWCLVSAGLDYYETRRSNGNMRKGDRAILHIIRVGNLRAEAVRLWLQVFFLAITLLFIQLPPPVPISPERLAQLTQRQLFLRAWGRAIMYMMPVAICALAMNSVWNYRDRRAISKRLHDMVRRRHDRVQDDG